MNKHLIGIIKETLSNNVPSRDDWMLVVKTVHDKEMEILNIQKEEFYDFFMSGKLSNVQTITRLWRLIQENHPDLRGEEWELRQRQGGMMSSEIVFLKQLKLFDI